MTDRQFLWCRINTTWLISFVLQSKIQLLSCKILADVNFSQRLSNQAIWAPPSLQLIPWVRKRLFCESSRLRGGLLTPLFVTTGTIQTQHINYDFFTFLSKTFTWMSYKCRCKTIISKKRKNTIYKYCFILMIGFWYSSSKYSSGFLLGPDQYLGRQCCRIYVDNCTWVVDVYYLKVLSASLRLCGWIRWSARLAV